jgi:hypothetical protein
VLHDDRDFEAIDRVITWLDQRRVGHARQRGTLDEEA